jgi:hypothetical protein
MVVHPRQIGLFAVEHGRCSARPRALGKQWQELQQKQAADHAQAAKQPSTSAAKVQELERQHQAQTQALAQRHTIEQKTLQETQEKKPEAKANAARHSSSTTKDAAANVPIVRGAVGRRASTSVYPP